MLPVKIFCLIYGNCRFVVVAKSEHFRPWNKAEDVLFNLRVITSGIISWMFLLLLFRWRITAKEHANFDCKEGRPWQSGCASACNTVVELIYLCLKFLFCASNMTAAEVWQTLNCKCPIFASGATKSAELNRRRFAVLLTPGIFSAGPDTAQASIKSPESNLLRCPLAVAVLGAFHQTIMGQQQMYKLTSLQIIFLVQNSRCHSVWCFGRAWLGSSMFNFSSLFVDDIFYFLEFLLARNNSTCVCVQLKTTENNGVAISERKEIAFLAVQ